MKTIGVIDYGSGNFGSVWNAISKLDVRPIRIFQAEQMELCDSIILPGVGAFGAAIDQLNKMDLISELNEQVLNKKKFFLGICVGMQILAKKGFEYGEYDGLGWIDGEVRKLEVTKGVPLPHIGWNTISQGLETYKLTKNMDGDASFYFVHSYVLETSDKDCKLLQSEYSSLFISAISKDNIYGVQFHPEKSQYYGLKLLENFVRL